MNDEELDITDEERAMAAELARALDSEREARAGSDAAFALALKATHTRSSVDPDIEARALERAVAASGKHQRRRTFVPLLLAAAVLLLAVPAAGTLNRLWTAPNGTPVAVEAPALPSADALLGAPIDEAQPAGDRALTLGRARTRSYFEGRIASERGAR